MTGIVFGVFDLLHIGHLNLLKKAKRRCDYLIVGLQVDPSIERKDKNKPIETVFERMAKLESLDYVNKVVVYQTEVDLVNILEYYKPEVRFLGSDYALGMKKITGESIVPIEFIVSISVHTTDIRERIK